ncbi:MAG TPA: hypothetical protein VH416_02220 [Gaiellaceae bacterium]|jgi:hypothetical protein
MARPKNHPSRPHRHQGLVVHVIEQRDGVPYELERRVCTTCGRELEQRRLRRAAA